MDRRFLCLYFPSLALDHFHRTDPGRRLRPFAVAREIKGHLYIKAANALAQSNGVKPGLRVADARALLPTLEIAEEDLETNREVKQRLIEWCDRYSPLVGDDGFGGIVLDITGCAHLFGGEASLLRDIQERIRKIGYRVRGAIADTLGAAWALARYRKQPISKGITTHDALDLLPIEALRVPKEITEEIRRVGLTTIAALRKIARHALATRYGSILLLRLDQAFGQAEEPFAPYRPPAPYRAVRMLAEPIGTLSAVEYILADLLKETCSRMEKEHMGARKIDLDCYRVDGTPAKCFVSTAKPVHSVSHLLRLFAEKLNTLDAGFGFEALILSVPIIERSDPAQLRIPGLLSDSAGETMADDPELDNFFDRLGMRLGFQEVCRPRICESLLPEYQIEFRPITLPAIANARWPEGRLRPVHLINPPLRIEVSTMLPGGLPVQFRTGRSVHRIVKAEGPERLTPEWWRDQSASWNVRDYYRIEDDQGARFWIFKERKSLSQPPHWFLSGHFA